MLSSGKNERPDERILELLNEQPRSIKDIEEELKKEGYPPDKIKEAVVRLHTLQRLSSYQIYYRTK